MYNCSKKGVKPFIMNSKEEVHYILQKIDSLNRHVIWNGSNRIQKSLWKTFSVTMTSILSGTLEMMALSRPNYYHYSPTLTSLTIRMMSTATILSSVIRIMMGSVTPINHETYGNSAWNGPYWSNRPFLRGDGSHILPIMETKAGVSLTVLIELDTNIISQSIQHIKECIMLTNIKTCSVEDHQQVLNPVLEGFSWHKFQSPFFSV
ncbi:hypothetical protein BCR42DRAFT_141864 [Absidia repens]|uniref:Uncharacterized protein n=1 Tax=Absidia repens TaxID=90262 RepID=A0A1X2I3Z1_9FUNG|nr:hypothetical protein BCR42DRAFT_141864 [Absidia repens]